MKLNYINDPIFNKDIFNDKIIVNTVNTKKIMGKGIALEFKMRNPKYYDDFMTNTSIAHGGDIYIYNNIISLATKEDWKAKTNIAWIKKGLVNIKNYLDHKNITDLYMPPIGSGLGGLNFKKDVEPLIYQIFNDGNYNINICQANIDTVEDANKLKFLIKDSNAAHVFNISQKIVNNIKDFELEHGIKLIRDIKKIPGIGNGTYERIINAELPKQIDLFNI